MVNPLAPVTVAYKTMNVGKLFCMSYYSDDAYMLAAAGDKGVVAIWESDEQVTRSLTHSPTHSLTHLLTHSLTHSPTHSLRH